MLRDEVMGTAQAAVAATLGGPDAERRVGVLNARMLGVTLCRYLIGVPAVAEASREQLEAVLLPALRAFVDPHS